MRRKIPKPYSEKTIAEKIAEHENAIANLEHPHNRYSRTCQDAARRHRETLTKLRQCP